MSQIVCYKWFKGYKMQCMDETWMYMGLGKWDVRISMVEKFFNDEKIARRDVYRRRYAIQCDMGGMRPHRRSRTPTNGIIEKIWPKVENGS